MTATGAKCEKTPKVEAVIFGRGKWEIRCGCRFLCVGDTMESAGFAYDLHRTNPKAGDENNVAAS